MKTFVKAVVSFPVFINQEIEHTNENDLNEAILEQADKYLAQGSVKPVIVDTSKDLTPEEQNFLKDILKKKHSKSEKEEALMDSIFSKLQNGRIVEEQD